MFKNYKQMGKAINCYKKYRFRNNKVNQTIKCSQMDKKFIQCLIKKKKLKDDKN